MEEIKIKKTEEKAEEKAAEEAMEELLILMKRRSNCFREIGLLTRELADQLQRNDSVSASIILNQRAEEMAKADVCREKLWDLGKQHENIAGLLDRLFADPPVEPGEDALPEEKKAYELRMEGIRMLNEAREYDRRLNRRLAGDKSYYS